MPSEPSIKEFIQVFLRSPVMNGPRIKILRAHFNSPNYLATASQLAQKVGYRNFNAVNLQYGKLAKSLSKELGWNEKEKSDHYMPWLSLLVFFRNPQEGDWELILRPNVVEALKKIGWQQEPFSDPSGPSSFKNDVLSEQESYHEGNQKFVYSVRYERDAKLRKKVIALKGTACICCGFDFEQAYGDIGKGFIHIHHTKPLSTCGGTDTPISPDELEPVCANCHMMIHRNRTSTLSIEDLKNICKCYKSK